MIRVGFTAGRATILAISVVLSVPGSVQAITDAAELFGRGYVSTAVIKDSGPHALFEETEIRVRFEHRDDYNVVQWQAGCNYFGAPRRDHR